MNVNRRQFMKLGAATPLGVHTVMATPWLADLFRNHLHAGGLDLTDRRMLVIFQRGGNDGVNTVIPRGDSDYNQTTRPTLFIPEANAIDLGNGFAQLHPGLSSMMEVYNEGDLAILHRVGYQGQSQSHFDSQQFWETGVPGDSTLEEGMIYRHIEQIRSPEDRFLAAAINTGQLVSLKGANSHLAAGSLAGFRFSGSPLRINKFLGQRPGVAGGIDGQGLLGIIDGPRDFTDKPYRNLVYGTTLSLTDSITTVQQALAAGYTAENGAAYPPGKFGDKLSQAALLFKNTPVRVVGVNIGGWDTHTNQGSTDGAHYNLLREVGDGFAALRRDLLSIWDDLVVVTMTEFGRTSRENGGFGTDHAYSTVMFVAGGAVNGGVYNCDTGTWANGDLFSVNNRYVAHRTDYRRIFADIFSWMGNNQLDATIPGYSSLSSQNDFQSLGFLPG